MIEHLYARHPTYTGQGCAMCGESGDKHPDDYYYLNGNKRTWLVEAKGPEEK